MAKKKASGVKKDEPSFEATIERLEEIVGELEQGETDLDQSLAQFEEGVKLMRRAHAQLADAERKIVLLTNVDEDGNAETTPLDENES
mgnify:CR=1 FL=1|jgi:exodeoxyribonuclease VII small subunit